jgi:acyl-CoA synthetase (AMP-forming)/AMP-acid ligase II
MNLAAILQEHAQRWPAVSAIQEPSGRQLTFAELDQAAAQAAGLLWQSGLRPGDPVLIFQPMSCELYVALAAVFRLGLVGMFLDPSAGRDHIERCCKLQPPRALIAGTKTHLLRLLSPALRAISIKFVIGFPLPGAISWSRAARTPSRDAIDTCEPETPALLTFTSGSTGEPKAAVRTHRFLLAQHRVLDASLKLKAGELDLTTMPIVLLANLASGVSSLIPDADLRRPGAINPAAVVKQIQAQGVVSSAASPAFFERLANYCSERHLTLPALRKLFTGGAPVFPRLLDKLRRIAPNAKITAVYGSTEAEPIAHVEYDQIEADDRHAMLRGRGLLAGQPVEAIRVGILRDQWGQTIGPYREADFAAECRAAEQQGEIVVSGEHVLPGYLHGTGDADTKFKVENTTWHRTGDAGYLDQRGRLWLLGRCSARIADRHGVLYPFTAEAAVYEDPQVRRAALVAHAGRRILAVEYCSRQPPDRAGLAQRLSWANLDEVRILRQIPVDRRHNAKVDYPELYRLLEAR